MLDDISSDDRLHSEMISAVEDDLSDIMAGGLGRSKSRGKLGGRGSVFSAASSKIKHATSSPAVELHDKHHLAGAAATMRGGRGGGGAGGLGATAAATTNGTAAAAAAAAARPHAGSFSNGHWARHIDDTTGIAYLYNATTGEESVWEERRLLLL